MGLPEMVPWTKKEAIELKKTLEENSSECPARTKNGSIISSSINDHVSI
jgi:hypothetical protein